jgi:hypothetical protein
VVLSDLYSVYQKIFPSYSDDPESWKLVKATALPRDEVERCFVYILFSRGRLEPGWSLDHWSCQVYEARQLTPCLCVAPLNPLVYAFGVCPRSNLNVQLSI